jgi:myo-inositol-1(or 4)-monophosphatase
MTVPNVDSAVEIALAAGSLLRYYFERKVTFDLKAEYDLVTEADRASEKMVVEMLRAKFPSHGIVAEEGGGIEAQSDYRWFVDPLDGTSNFAHGYPVWCVTLAAEKAGELVVGVTWDPIRGELFTAEKGAGAFLNGRRLRVSKTATLASAMMVTGFPNHNRLANPNIHFYHQMALSTHGVRRSGSAALDMASVSSGRLDSFWEIGLNPWDIAAGKLLVTEAGGKCTTMTGDPHHHVGAPHLLADNGLLHDETTERFREIFAGKPRHPYPVLGSVLG